jgi:hypothetical protein
LRFADVERHAADVAQILVARPDGEFAGQIAIGRTVVAATTGLVEHQLAVFLLQRLYQIQRGIRRDHFVDHIVLQHVIPAQAGIQRLNKSCEADNTRGVAHLRGNFFQLDSGLRRNDELFDFRFKRNPVSARCN